MGETAWWKFDETSGNTAYDSSSHGNHGTVYGATCTGGGLNFDGVDNYVDFDNHSVNLGINKTDNITVIVRLRSTDSGMLYSMSHTDSARPYFDLKIDSSGKVGFISEDITWVFELYTSGSYNNGAWHILEVEYLGSTEDLTVNLYIDDNLDGTKTDWTCSQIDEDYKTAKVVRKSNSKDDYFDGEIDEVKIYKFFSPTEPPRPPTIKGPDNGKKGQELIYIFNAIDVDSEYIKFHIDWGDGNTEWTAYIPQGIDKIVSHIWEVVDTYIITAYAEDDSGSIGPSTTKQVTIPRDKSTNNMLLLRLLEKFYYYKNYPFF